MKRKITQITLFLVLMVSPLLLSFSQTVYADTTITCNDGTVVILPTDGGSPDDRAAAKCPDPHGGVKVTASDTSITEPDAKPKDCTGADLNRDNYGIIRYLAVFINVLSAVVGIVVTGVIIWGGIEYSMSSGDPSKVQAAKKKIYNGIISMIAFIFTFAFLQYIVPGGLL